LPLSQWLYSGPIATVNPPAAAPTSAPVCYLHKHNEALKALNKSLEVKLPPLLLKPLFWIENDNPEFFKDSILPIIKTRIV
jgi:hypothetical protein